MTRRVLVGGLYHETNTFLSGLTTLAAFSVRKGRDMLACAGDGSPLGAALCAARELEWDVVAAADYRAMPGPTVSDAVVEGFRADLERAATEEPAGGLHGIFLVLHGAMVSESVEDVEGRVLERVRHLPGAESVPICGTLDLHANVSSRLAQHSDALLAYRENPHTDARDTAVRAARILHRLMAEGRRAATVWVPVPVMWPPTGTATEADPLASLEAAARDIEARRPEIMAVNVLSGFAFADCSRAGVSFTAVTQGDPDAARAELLALREWTLANRDLGYPHEEALEDVMRGLPRDPDGPVLLVEPSDNIGAGAPGDGTTVLRALVEHDVDRAAVVINDPVAVDELGRLRPGAQRRTSIGGKTSPLTDGPIELAVELVSLSDGRFTLEDEQSHLASMCGREIDMGPCAVVRHRGVLMLLTSRPTPPFDLGQLRSQGIDPERLAVIGVKAAVAHRRAYDPIAGASHTVSTPGPCASDLRALPYRRVRRPICPLDGV